MQFISFVTLDKLVQNLNGGKALPPHKHSMVTLKNPLLSLLGRKIRLARKNNANERKRKCPIEETTGVMT